MNNTMTTPNRINTNTQPTTTSLEDSSTSIYNLFLSTTPTTSNTALRTSSDSNGIKASSRKTTMRGMNTTEFTSADILCGKDKTYSKHGGNQRFRQLIQDYVQPYQAATSKQQKMTITKEIVTQLETVWSARFLKMVDTSSATGTATSGAGTASGEWQEISTQNARDKTSHALRFAAGKCKDTRRRPSASSISSSLKVVAKSNSLSPKSSSHHRRNVSVDASLNDSSQYTSTSNHEHDSSCNSSVGSHSSSSSDEALEGAGAVHQSLLDRQRALFSEVVLEGGAAVVKGLFDRQQAILIKMRHSAGDVDADDDDEEDAEVQAITERTASAHVTTTATTTKTEAPEPRELEEEFKREDEFPTLRSEDMEQLLDDPLVEGEWDNVMDLTR